MTTKNVRVVGYLPPPEHEKLREYMREESLTESAAIIKIVKQFFDGSVETKTPDAAKEKDQAIADLKADVVELKRRLAVLEQAVVSGLTRPFANSRTSQKQRLPMTLPPQSSNDLARRLGVSTGTLKQADEKGEAYFKDWSRRMDPTQRSWYKQGELFYPESD
jgi:hypothetical protein